MSCVSAAVSTDILEWPTTLPEAVGENNMESNMEGDIQCSHRESLNTIETMSDI